MSENILDSGETENRILAIDFGIKRVGVAITDPSRTIAYPFSTLDNDPLLIRNLKRIVEEKGVALILVGDTGVSYQGKSKIADQFQRFLAALKKSVPCEIIIRDEMYTSKMASERILVSVPGKMKRRDKSLIDRNAACILLEDYLRKTS